MSKIGTWTQSTICAIIDFFYWPIFRRFFSLQFFRYCACGIFNVLLDWTLFYIFYHFVFHMQVVDFNFFQITPHIASFVFEFPITFTIGFLLSRYITFTGSELESLVQMYRYAMVVVGCILINYFCLKVLVETFHFYAMPSKMITTIFTTMFSYFTQRHFTFKV